MKTRGVVTFLSDYGLQDEFVGVCRGVMLRIAPQLRIVDVHHYILRQSIRHGAIVMQQAIRFLPDAVHLAVVDPSVGSGRRALAMESGDGQVFVGPDNGLLLPAVDQRGGVARAISITNDRYLLTPVSRTFQGRDVFAPVAAHVANGVDIAELGEPVAEPDLVRLEIPQAWIHDDHLHAEVLQVDRFGNLQLNFGSTDLAKVQTGDGRELEVRMEGHRVSVPWARTFAEVEAGDFVLVEDSYGHISLAVNKGDAAARLRAGAGSTAIVGPSGG
ncbi:MAG: S-adenosyl-l-methionine hydroxide adenosyltransferase family protein [Actinomycetota bacterium]